MFQTASGNRAGLIPKSAATTMPGDIHRTQFAVQPAEGKIRIVSCKTLHSTIPSLPELGQHLQHVDADLLWIIVLTGADDAEAVRRQYPAMQLIGCFSYSLFDICFIWASDHLVKLESNCHTLW